MKSYRLLLGAGLLLLGLQGRADLVLIINKSNAVHLDAVQVRNIFLGRSHYFPDGQPVIPLQQVPGSPAYEEFSRELIHKDDARLRAYWSRMVFTGRGLPPRVVASAAQAIDRVAHHPEMIAYVPADSPGLDQVRVLRP